MKKAFTMIELLVVMVVGAILSAVAVSKIHTSELIDTARNIANDISYTRILALGVDAYNGTASYDNNYYIFTIDSGKNNYKISNKSMNDKTFQKNDYAVDYIDNTKRICDFHNDECVTRARIEKKKDNLEFTPSVATYKDGSYDPTNSIIFNELGEPLNFNKAHSSFQIELTKGSEKVYVCVEKYTGFVHIEKSACK